MLSFYYVLIKEAIQITDPFLKNEDTCHCQIFQNRNWVLWSRTQEIRQ